MKNLFFSLLVFLVLILGFSTTSAAVSIAPVVNEQALSTSTDFSLFNEYSGFEAVPYNPFSDCTIKNDCSPHKHLSPSISKLLLIINTDKSIFSLFFDKKIISNPQHKPNDIIPALHSPPPRS